MRKFLMGVLVLGGAMAGALGAQAAPAARLAPAPSYAAPEAQPVQYYEDWRHREWRRREAYERWRRHEARRHWRHEHRHGHGPGPGPRYGHYDGRGPRW